ncbi:CbtA family protein [Beijerinckia indica]|uniref:Cobalt transporter, subunit CbtA n=1 Tax=Beijerinckia indica subsp. indica (strain ATCC 9039 / DSM 1715 / NCIMB 8712) TaxID=395963 RepID=B2IBF9_BEII9|nr:CbtA family protein [Beijerinckia indica]ACB96585.1 conserved hypothetical protein [Beijerinckia indica subsp. indica ATCC 9039]
MVARLLLRGMVVGLFAGLLAFGCAKFFGEPQIERAIAFEHQNEANHAGTAQEHDHHGHHHEAAGEAQITEIVSRETQAGLGLLTGLVIYGAAIGGFFALGFACLHGRVDHLDARANSVLLALGGFVALVLVPSLKYPANPPAVGEAATIGPRTAAFFLMLALSIAALTGAVTLARRLIATCGAWNAALLGAAFYLICLGLVFWILPDFNEIPAGFSADLLWHFRLSAVGIQLVLWATLGFVFGPLAESLWAKETQPAGRLRTF